MSQNPQENTCANTFFNTFFNKVAGLIPQRLWHSCLPVNFAKFLRPLFTEHLQTTASVTGFTNIFRGSLRRHGRKVGPGPGTPGISGTPGTSGTPSTSGFHGLPGTLGPLTRSDLSTLQSLRNYLYRLKLRI